MRKHLFLLGLPFICLLLPLKNLGQNEKMLVQFPSPEATNMAIVGALPMSLHTGKVSVNIPIEAGDGKHLQPMSLNYNTEGIRPDFHPGWVGLNWTLNAGGVVTRSMNGIPDETVDAGFYYKYSVVNSLANFTLDNYSGSAGCWNRICATADGAADEFYVSAPGISGKFQLDYSGVFRMVEDPSVRIESEGMFFDISWGYVDLAYKPFKGFTVIKNDGTKYRFGYTKELIETTHAVSSDFYAQGVASGWYLAQVIYPDRDTVNFNYTGKVLNYTPSGNDRNIYTYNTPGQEVPPTNGRSIMYGEAGINISATNHAYLKTIESSLAKIEFFTATSNELKNGQCDLGNWKRLDSIVLTNLLVNRREKSFVFNYDQSISKRLTLLSVTTKGLDNRSLPPYRFTYDPSLLPPYQSGQLDFWGYYNNSPFPHMVPTAIWPDATSVFYYSANREPDVHAMGNGMLKEITYPTGGSVTIEYESNDYSSFREFTDNSNSVYVKPVQYGWEQQRYFGEPQTYYNNFHKTAALYYQSSPLTLTKYANAQISGGGLNGTTRFLVLEPGTYTSQSIQQILGVPYNIANGYTINYLEFVPRKKSLGAGLRVKRITHKSTDSEDMVHEYVYAKNFLSPNYDPELSSGILGNRGAFVVAPVRGGTYLNTLTFSISQSPDILTDGGPIGYSEVVDITKDRNGNILGYEISKYSNFDTNPDELPTAYGGSAMLIAKKNNKYYERGKLLESVIYNSSGEKVSKTTNYYQPLIFSITNGATIRGDFLYGTPVGVGASGIPGQLLLIQYKDYFGYSPLISQTHVQYSNNIGQSLTTTTSYQYNVYNLPQIIKTTTLTGETKQTFTYSTDISASQYEAMVRRNIINHPIETVSYNNSIVSNGVLNTYKWQIFGSDTFFVKDKIYKLSIPSEINSITPYDGSNLNNNYEGPFVEYKKYDEKLNITEASQRNALTASYVWGYRNHLPVAEAVNAKENEVFFDGLEDGSGWDSYLSAYDNARSHTGRRSGRIDRFTAGEQVVHSTKWLNVTLTQPTKFKYSGWFYSTGPAYQIYLFMKTASETGYYTYVDVVGSTTTNKWVYIEKEFVVQPNVTRLNIRVDNDGGGSIWFDDIRLHPADAQMTTYTYDPIVGMTSNTDVTNNVTHFQYDAFSRLTSVLDNDRNIIKAIDYRYSVAGKSTGPGILVTVSNLTTKDMVVTYTNQANSNTYSFSITAGSNNIKPGTIPSGTYSVAISPSNPSPSYHIKYKLNNSSQMYYGSVTFSSVSLTDDCILQITPPQPVPIMATNTSTKAVTLVYTNQSTSGTFSFTIPPGSNNINAGSIPDGTYSVTMTASNSSSSYPIIYKINGVSQTYYAAVTFGGVYLYDVCAVDISAPPSIEITGTNSIGTPVILSFKNLSTNHVYSLTLNSGSSAASLGTVPAGAYNVTFAPDTYSSSSPNVYKIYTYTQSYYAAVVFGNVLIDSPCPIVVYK